MFAKFGSKETRLEQRQAHWPRLEKTSRAMAILFAVAAMGFAIAGGVLSYLDRPNPIVPLALSFVRASLPLGLLGQALRGGP